jgi:hypothetical protein
MVAEAGTLVAWGVISGSISYAELSETSCSTVSECECGVNSTVARWDLRGLVTSHYVLLKNRHRERRQLPAKGSIVEKGSVGERRIQRVQLAAIEC